MAKGEFSPSRYYRQYSDVNADTLAAAIAEQAREELKYARKRLKEYRAKVNRAVVSGDDQYEYMGGNTGICYGLWALHAVCDSFNSRIEHMGRLARVLQKHAERINGQLEALYKQDRDQILAARKAEREARMAELLR